MKTIKVRLKPEIARTGAGFIDIAGGQTLMPPAVKGVPDVTRVFCVKHTPFVESKLRTGELMLAEPVAVDAPADAGDDKNKGNNNA